MRQNRGKVIGLTGGVGSGKSCILNYLKEAYGAYIIEADQVAKDQMKKGTVCFEQIVGAFGKSILGAEGELDRKKLSDLVFGNKEKLSRLNALTHPAVKSWISNEVQKRKGQLIVIEAALLIEEHYDAICHELWYVYVKEEVRRSRLKASRGYTDEKISDILRNQLTEQQFRQHCQVVIDNNGTLTETIRQVKELEGRLYQ